MDPVKYDQLVSLISCLAECEEVQLQALWQRMAGEKPQPPADELLRCVQARLARSGATTTG